MQKIPHKFKVLRKQHSMILVNPVTIENHSSLQTSMIEPGCFKEVAFVER